MTPNVNTQSEPMGTDGQTDKRTNGQTDKQTNRQTNGRMDKYLLIYSGISSHSLRGVRIYKSHRPTSVDTYEFSESHPGF